LETVNIFGVMVQPKLSQLQRQILCEIRRSVQNFGSFQEAETQGVPYVPRNWFKSPPTSASLSRALFRLEERGLIIRSNIHTGADAAGAAPVRTTHVRLTPEGRAVADELRSPKEKRLISPRY
jgi:DNA-binding HxlR family transcriptional regulator